MTQAQYTTQIYDNEIKISSAALEQLKGLMASADENISGIRIYVSGGGCGGMTYGMTFAENQGPMDKVLESDGFKIVVDVVALGYLTGCDIDFVDNGLNKSFVFNNVFQSVGGSGGCSGCGGGGF